MKGFYQIFQIEKKPDTDDLKELKTSFFVPINLLMVSFSRCQILNVTFLVQMWKIN